MRTYIAGPMSNMPDLNFPAFHAAAALYRSRGYEVVNPAELNGGADELVACANMTAEELVEHWRKCMRKDLAAICNECDHIVLLEGWERSRGARAEHWLAELLGLKITYPDPAAGYLGRITPPMRRLLDRVAAGTDIYAGTATQYARAAVTRTRDALMHWQFLDNQGHLTPKGREVLK